MAHKMYLKQERNDYTGGMPVVNLDKGDVICSQSQHTGNDSRSFLRWGTSNRASITSASVCSSNISTQQHHASSSDWGFLEVEISKLSIKQISLIVGAMKHLIVVYDACQAHRNDIPNEVMEEFLLNSYLLVPFVSQEVQRAASEYVKEQRIIKMQAKKEAMEASRKIRQEAIYEKHLNNTAAIGGRHGPQDVIEIRGVKQYKLQGSIRSTKNISPPFVPLTRESDSKHEYFRRDDSAGPRPAFKRHVISTEGKTPFLGLKVKPKRYDANTEIVTVQAVTGPSEAAGLQEGDEILRVGGKVVTNLKGFNALLAREASKPGILLNILYDRNGKTIETTITVGER